MCLGAPGSSCTVPTDIAEGEALELLQHSAKFRNSPAALLDTQSSTSLESESLFQATLFEALAEKDMGCTDADMITPVLTAFFHQSKKNAGILIDVGANIGSATARMLEVYDGLEFHHFKQVHDHKDAVCATDASPLEVHAFEPNPASFASLKQRSVDDNWQSKHIVHLHQTAVSDKPGTVSLFHGSGTDEGASLLKEGANGNEDTDKVEAIKLDDLFLNSSSHIHLLKVDTEGFDGFVLRGAKKLLEQNMVSYIVFEYSRKWQSTPEPMSLQQTTKELYDQGYACFMMTPDTLVPLWQQWWKDEYEVYQWSNIFCGQRNNTELAEVYAAYGTNEQTQLFATGDLLEEFNQGSIPTSSKTEQLEYFGKELQGALEFLQTKLGCTDGGALIHLLKRNFDTSEKKHKGVLVDVGANIGSQSSRMLEVYGGLEYHKFTRHFKDGYIVCQDKEKAVELYAFEPNPETFENMRERSEEESWGVKHNIHLVEAAVSDKAGNMSLYHGEGTDEAASLSSSANGDLYWKSDTVDVVVLDTFFNSTTNVTTTPIHLLKIDAEGFDGYVLRGATNLLRGKNVEYIVFEYSKRWQNTPTQMSLQQTSQELSDLGYACFLILPHTLVPISEQWWQPVYEFYERSNVFCAQADDSKLFNVYSGYGLHNEHTRAFARSLAENKGMILQEEEESSKEEQTSEQESGIRGMVASLWR